VPEPSGFAAGEGGVNKIWRPQRRQENGMAPLLVGFPLARGRRPAAPYYPMRPPTYAGPLESLSIPRKAPPADRGAAAKRGQGWLTGNLP